MTSLRADISLVDGSGFIFRAFHALPPLTRPDGVPVGAVYGFTTMLLKLIQETQEGSLAVIFDAARETFRQKIYPAYKAHRPPPPPELIPQFALIREACDALNVPWVCQEGYEADDLMATYARQAVNMGMPVTLVSSDKDLMQLVSPYVRLRDPLKNTFIGPDEVHAKFGVRPENVVDVQALAGDPSDNVPGVPGIGVKIASELISQYGDLETLLAHASDIKQPKRRQALLEHQQDARISYKLVTLCTDVPVTTPLEAFKKRPLVPETFLSFLKEQNFKTLFTKFSSLAKDSSNAEDPSTYRPKTQREGEMSLGLSSFPKVSAWGLESRAASEPSSGVEPGVASGLQSGECAKPDLKAELIVQEHQLDSWIQKIYAEGRVALDTETTGLNPHQDALVGVSLCCERGHAAYIPLQHTLPALSLPFKDVQGDDPQTDPRKIPTFQDQLPMSSVLQRLKPLLVDPAIIKIGHNIKFDMHVLKQHGLDITPLEDTMVMSYVLDGTQHGHSLDELARLHFNHTTLSFKDVCGSGKAQITFDKVPLDRALDYAAEDAHVTLQLYDYLKPQIKSQGLLSLYQGLERLLIPVLFRMEHIGIKVDAQHLKDLSQHFQKQLTVLEKEIYDLAGQPFNIASPKQLGDILFEVLKLGEGKRTKSGIYQTHSEVLERLREKHTIAHKVLLWRQMAKLKSTYTHSLIQEINPRTGRVHTSYGMTITNTGRLSSSSPNLQNIPVRSEEGRLIRRAFVAEKGKKLVSLDYSQIELRLLTHGANIPSLREAFRQGGDIHTLTASQVFGIPLSKVDSSLRSKAKAINFGIIYGISAFGLAQQLDISKAQAKDYIQKYLNQYPGIHDFMESQKAFAHEHGYVETFWGRRIFVPGIQSKNPAVRAMAQRQAINAPLQGANADIIKRAMIQISDHIQEKNLQVHMLLQVHDELIFEMTEEVMEEAIPLFKKIMETVVTLSVPLVVDQVIGKSWDALD